MLGVGGVVQTGEEDSSSSEVFGTLTLGGTV